MKFPAHSAAIFLVLAMVAFIAGSTLLGSRQLRPEPVWNGKPLFDWLDIYDSSLRFPVGDGRHPRESDAEIEHALNGIGTNALPYLQAWLVQKPERIRPWLNKHLTRLGLGRFCLQLDEKNYTGMSETGFMYYGSMAEPLLPWLSQLTHDEDADMRMLAYEAAFFARPKKEIFLPLADQALHDEKADCEDTAAQWMLERFPEEGIKRNLNLLYPQFCENSSNTNADAP